MSSPTAGITNLSHIRKSAVRVGEAAVGGKPVMVSAATGTVAGVGSVGWAQR